MQKKSIEAPFDRWPICRSMIVVKMLIGYLGLSLVVVLIAARTLVSLEKLNEINRDTML